MPRIEPDILHRPLALPALSSFEQAMRWLAEGAASWLPAGMRNMGWRAESSLYHFDQDHALAPKGVVERSWTGDMRTATHSAGPDNIPAAVLLDPAIVFLTHADLPATARHTLQKTVALQLDELSPIPPEQTAFSIGSVSISQDRLHVKIAIVRKQNLDAVKAAMSERAISAIGAGLSESNLFQFVFFRYAGANRWRKWLMGGAAMWASIMLALGAYGSRQESIIAALDQRQIELRHEIQKLRAAEDDLTLLQRSAPKMFSVVEANEIMASTLGALPDGSVISDISIMGDHVSASGLAPNGVVRKAGAFSFHHSDYPGFDRFTLSAPLRSANIAEGAND